MILERVEKDEVVNAIYESSNILASTYNKNNKNLNIIFKNGGSYTYQNVPQTDYLRFEIAESQGQILNSQIKKYPFLKHENVDTEAFLNKIKDIKEAEVKALELGVITQMKGIIAEYGVNNKLNSESLIELNKILEVYNKTK